MNFMNYQEGMMNGNKMNGNKLKQNLAERVPGSKIGGLNPMVQANISG